MGRLNLHGLGIRGSVDYPRFIPLLVALEPKEEW
jgi:hypothetical protein